MLMNRSSLSVAQHANFRAYPLRNTFQESPVRAAPPLGVRRISAAEATESLTKKKAPPPKSAVGFLLMDSALNLISSNVEATQILGYPDKLANLRHSDVSLTGKVCSGLISQQRPSGESPFVTEFRSGRRRYFCRVFQVGSPSKAPSHPSIAVLLERGPSGLVPLLQVSQQFNLTQREREVLEYLLQGLSSKEIANRMNLSPNTVKAFLRMIMIKAGVSSRSTMVAKIVMTQRH